MEVPRINGLDRLAAHGRGAEGDQRRGGGQGLGGAVGGRSEGVHRARHRARHQTVRVLDSFSVLRHAARHVDPTAAMPGRSRVSRVAG